MDYYLENVRTGESIPVNPDRMLIGNADHASIRVEGGPFLAALFVNYPSGWSIHGLSDEAVKYNGKPLRVTQQLSPRAGDVLEVAGEFFRLVASGAMEEENPPPSTPACFAYIRFPDGMEECRTVDHNLLFGRLKNCHVRYPDNKLSRMNALFAPHQGVWYVHTLAKGMIARNRHAVSDFAVLEDGDELIIGPLNVRIEMEASYEAGMGGTAAKYQDQPVEAPPEEEPNDASDQAATPSGLNTATVETTLPEAPDASGDPEQSALYHSGLRLDLWLKSQKPQPQSGQAGLGGWLDSQKQRLKRFWYDTPETTMARALRTSGKPDDAFALLDRAIRARPDSPDLLRELFRLYEGVGLYDLGFRPLRQIEKLAAARGSTDTWVLETLARLCERLGRKRAGMFDRAIGYWNKLEKATGVSYARERQATMASRTLREAGFAKIVHEDD